MVLAAIIVSSVVTVVVALLIAFAAITRAVAAKGRQRIADKFPADAIVLADDLANNFGLTSKGVMQVRGNGGLVLTRDALWFLPIVGDEWSVPRSKITSVGTVRSHLGKTVGRPLLKIEWTDDSAAFFVRDLPPWLDELQPGARG